MRPAALAATLSGRTDERARLLDAVRAGLDGSPQAVLVHGEAGIGKTTLVRSVCEKMKFDGAQMLWGRASALDGGGDVPPAGAIAACATADLGWEQTVSWRLAAALIGSGAPGTEAGELLRGVHRHAVQQGERRGEPSFTPRSRRPPIAWHLTYHDGDCTQPCDVLAANTEACCALIAGMTSGSSAMRSRGSTFRRPSPAFANLREPVRLRLISKQCQQTWC